MYAMRGPSCNVTIEQSNTLEHDDATAHSIYFIYLSNKKDSISMSSLVWFCLRLYHLLQKILVLSVIKEKGLKYATNIPNENCIANTFHSDFSRQFYWTIFYVLQYIVLKISLYCQRGKSYC